MTVAGFLIGLVVFVIFVLLCHLDTMTDQRQSGLIFVLMILLVLLRTFLGFAGGDGS